MMTLQKHMPDAYKRIAYKRIARMVGYCLVSPDEASMWAFSAILYARLQPGQRKFLAVALLMSLSDDECHAVHDFLEGDCLSRPVDLFLHHLPQVASEATDPRVKNFVAEMANKTNWRNWEPTAKQRAIMDRLVNKLFSHSEELVVIE